MNRVERIAKGLTAAFSGSSILAISNDVEFVYGLDGVLQIGMGGEWWAGRVKLGKNIFRHRKESVDPAYQPVVVIMRDEGDGVRFDVSGGFGHEASFVLMAKGR